MNAARGLLQRGIALPEAVRRLSREFELSERQAYRYLGGPVWIPKVYNGHNRTFFFADYQGTRQSTSAGNTIGFLPARLGTLERYRPVALAGTRRAVNMSSGRESYSLSVRSTNSMVSPHTRPS